MTSIRFQEFRFQESSRRWRRQGVGQGVEDRSSWRAVASVAWAVAVAVACQLASEQPVAAQGFGGPRLVVGGRIGGLGFGSVQMGYGGNRFVVNAPTPLGYREVVIDRASPSATGSGTGSGTPRRMWSFASDLTSNSASARPDAPAVDVREELSKRFAELTQEFHHDELFTPEWFAARDPASVWSPQDRSLEVWATPSWDDVNAFFQTGWAPNYYDYGNTLSFDSTDMLSFSRPFAKVSAYAAAARKLAGSGASESADMPWLSLGVFGVAASDQKQLQAAAHLAVNRQGRVRGTWVELSSGHSWQITGAVNLEYQRVAWGGQQGEWAERVFDTGLYNLAQPAGTVLIHGPLQPRYGLLVRIARK